MLDVVFCPAEEREGSGILNLKHLWVQELVRADDVRDDWIPREKNPADVLTHPTTKSELQRTLEWLPERFVPRALHPRYHFVRSEGVWWLWLWLCGCWCWCWFCNAHTHKCMHTGTHTHSRAQTAAHFVSASFLREAVLDTWQALYRPRSWSWPMAVPQRKVPKVG